MRLKPLYLPEIMNKNIFNELQTKGGKKIRLVILWKIGNSEFNAPIAESVYIMSTGLKEVKDHSKFISIRYF